MNAPIRLGDQEVLNPNEPLAGWHMLGGGTLYLNLAPGEYAVGDGQSVLYLAVAMDNPDIVRLLLELGATTDWEDANGDSPMDLARSDAVREALLGG